MKALEMIWRFITFFSYFLFPLSMCFLFIFIGSEASKNSNENELAFLILIIIFAIWSAAGFKLWNKAGQTEEQKKEEKEHKLATDDIFDKIFAVVENIVSWLVGITTFVLLTAAGITLLVFLFSNPIWLIVVLLLGILFKPR